MIRKNNEKKISWFKNSNYYSVPKSRVDMSGTGIPAVPIKIFKIFGVPMSTGQIKMWVPMGTGLWPDKKFLGYRPDRKLWVPTNFVFMPTPDLNSNLLL